MKKGFSISRNGPYELRNGSRFIYTISNGIFIFRSLWYKAKARTEKEQTSFSFGWLQRAAARARHTACQCRRRRFRRRTRPHQAAGSWAAKRRLSVPEAPKYIKVRKVFDLSRLHLALLGLNSSSQADLLWLVTLPLKVKHFVVMYHECTLLIDAH